MSAEANKILLRRYIEERWNERKFGLTDELVSPDFVLHTPSGDVNLEAFNEAIAAYLGSFPDSQVSIEDLVAEEDRVAMVQLPGHASRRIHGNREDGKAHLLRWHGVLSGCRGEIGRRVVR